MTTKLATGKTVEEAKAIQQHDILHALGGFPKETEHCALLSANTLHAACGDAIRRGHIDRSENSTQVDSCDSCDSRTCSAKARRSDENDQEYAERQELERRLCRIRNKVLVLSGKGGVGKSTVAANLAVSLVQAGKKVGLLDLDVHGPSIPRLLGLEGQQITGSKDGLLPVWLNDKLAVMSIGFLIDDKNTPVIWRGPKKYGVIRQFLKDVVWGDLDYLIVDSPPGTGDEPLSAVQLLGAGASAVIVTTPQDVAVADVRRCVTFCRQLALPIVGILENMSGYVCPKCGLTNDIFSSGGGEDLAEEMGIPFLGHIPIEPGITISGDLGEPFTQSRPQAPASEVFASVVRRVLDDQTSGTTV
jgi:Mrp family chromosome partitioning ATPase